MIINEIYVLVYICSKQIIWSSIKHFANNSTLQNFNEPLYNELKYNEPFLYIKLWFINPNNSLLVIKDRKTLTLIS